LACETETSGFVRHLRACNNAALPGDRLPFLIGGTPVGWVKPDFAAALAARREIVQDSGRLVLRDAAAFQDIARDLAARGFYSWRNEAFDVRASPDGPALAQLDRGALPSFGVFAAGVHVNGLVRRADGLHIWVARRAADRLLDPDKLDHLTAGGIPAGLTPEQTLLKEAQEEAAIPSDLARQARRAGTITYAMERPEGLRRDMLYCYDLELPEDFEPRSTDGEVASFALWPIARALETVRDTDAFKFNVNLVLIDLFVREGLLPPLPVQGAAGLRC
jgi:8-oxo-dGTP pyrophosphatase MutT (NUDIX family)